METNLIALHFNTIKTIIGIFIFLGSLIFGFYPIFLTENNNNKIWLIGAESFAGGILLGAGLIHLLPDSITSLNLVYHGSYPIAFAICAATIMLLRLIEEGFVVLLNKTFIERKTWFAFMLMIMLTVHSIFEGLAIGIEKTITGFLIIVFAVLAHKGSESFALGIKMRTSTMKKNIQTKLMMLFSIMTPLGILAGSLIRNATSNNIGHMMCGIFEAIAAGTFMYIATFHFHSVCHSVEEKNDHENYCDCDKFNAIQQLLFFAIGLIIMAVVAIFL